MLTRDGVPASVSFEDLPGLRVRYGGNVLSLSLLFTSPLCELALSMQSILGPLGCRLQLPVSTKLSLRSLHEFAIVSNSTIRPRQRDLSPRRIGWWSDQMAGKKRRFPAFPLSLSPCSGAWEVGHI